MGCARPQSQYAQHGGPALPSRWGLISRVARLGTPRDFAFLLRLPHLHLTRYSADGTVLGQTSALFPQFGEVRSFSLNVDAAGNAVLTYGKVSGTSGTGPYAVSSLDGSMGIASTGPYPVAPSADGEIDVATTIRTFDAQLQQVGETLVLRGLENPQLVPAEPSVFTIAGTRITTRPCSAGNGGDSLGGDEGTTPGCYIPPWGSNPARASTGSSASAQGVLLRLRNKAPDFVQAHATDAEWGAASSIGGMVVGDANCSFVLRHQRDPNTAAVLPLSSLLRFDAQGNIVWELELPGDVDYTSVLAVADGGVIVDDGTLPNRVFHVSPGGVIDWAYQVDSTQDFVTDPSSRMAYTNHRRWIDGTSQVYSLVTISGDGSRCEMYGLIDSQSTDAKADSVTTVVHSPYVYLQRVTDIRRYRLPTP